MRGHNTVLYGIPDRIGVIHGILYERLSSTRIESNLGCPDVPLCEYECERLSRQQLQFHVAIRRVVAIDLKDESYQ